MDRKVILLELNEVPYKIYDYYCEQRPNSALARTLGRCRQYETVSPEEKEQLHPWCTWPTLHRGVDTNTHGIQRVGQDLNDVNERYASVWSLLADAGVTTGVFGPFNSYPLPADHQKYAFYLPDVFALEESCWPESLKPFQRFSLRMTEASGRNVSRGIDLQSAAGFLATAPFLGLRPRTVGKLAKQLMDERKDPWKSGRRRTYQSVVAFDLFMKQLERHRPQFSNLFSNHVASSMHRYWAAAFPDEYDDNQYDETWRRRYRDEILFTMDVTDDVLARLAEFSDANPEYLLLIASSMGQAAASGEPILYQATVGDMDLFMKVAGFEENEYQRKPAMEPLHGVHVEPERQAEFVAFLKTISVGGVSPTPLEREDGYVAWATPGINVDPDEEVALVGGVEMALKDLGLINQEVEDGSGTNGYHIPEGSLLVYDPTRGFEGNSERQRVSTLDVAPFLLDLFNVPVPDYMRPASAISLD